MFKPRREALMQALGGGVAIFPANPERRRTADLDYPYRQHSDFFYLTGYTEPDSVLVLMPDHPDYRMVLFVRPRDPEMETWNGRRAGIEGAIRDFGADAAFPIDQIDQILPRYLEGQTRLHYRMGEHGAFDERVLGWVNAARRKARSGVGAPTEILDPSRVLHEMRLFKSDEELDLMRRSAEIAAAGHVAAMQVCRPGGHEYELEATLLHAFRMAGAMGPAYGCIVGSGENGCILHYHENEAPLRDGDLVLIDAGAEYRHYASDITRTFPVNGRFTDTQRAVYQVVLDAQKAAIEVIRPGRTFQDVHDVALRVLVEGLVSLGILEGRVEDLIEDGAYRPFYMHKTSHWIGIDVHDVGAYKQGNAWRKLEPGMVLTVEPGLYFARGGPEAARAFEGIGIRIEDDVVVTAEGHEVLTHGVPKDIAAIEHLMGQA